MVWGWMDKKENNNDGWYIPVYQSYLYNITTALLTAVTNEYRLDKEATSHDYCRPDAFRSSLGNYEFAKGENVL
jgi:hypothetical protein